MAAESKSGELGSNLISFELPGIDGKVHSSGEYDKYDVLVIIFMCNHCPYVKAVMGRLVRLQKDLERSGVCLVGINPNDDSTYPEDSFEKMIEFASGYEMNFPYLKDESQDVAKAYEAVCTPDIYVYDKGRQLRYRGRIDDNWKEESLVTTHDLRNAIGSLLKGKEVPSPQFHSIGCSIKWKQS
ncbi:MAG: thioredoxin family protein [Ignavibacteria bacterium]|nr:thioredoxin family protein [Ignavibacteria bacterium]